MGSLREALRAKGLGDDRQYYESIAASQLQEEAAEAKRKQAVKEKERRLEILQKATSPDSFRPDARKLLLAYPEMVQEILNIAHSRGLHEKRKQGGGRLIANLYELRNALKQSGLSDEEKRTLVDKLFTKR